MDKKVLVGPYNTLVKLDLYREPLVLSAACAHFRLEHAQRLQVRMRLLRNLSVVPILILSSARASAAIVQPNFVFVLADVSASPLASLPF